jgi:hypothetical protein
MMKIKKLFLSLYSSVNFHQDIVHLVLQYDSWRDRVWQASIEYILKNCGVFRKYSCLTLFFRNPSLRYCAPWAPIRLLERSSLVSVYVRNSKSRHIERVSYVSLYCFVILRQDIVHLLLRFDSPKGKVPGASVQNEKKTNLERWWKDHCSLTVLCDNPWARYCAPLSPIRLLWR